MRKQHAAAAAIFIVLAILMTWPLAPRINHVVSDPGDPYINIWILDWDDYATFHQPLSLFEANIFYPAHDTLAFSENLYGIALFLMPFRALGVGPVTAHNIAMLAGFAFSGFAAYLLGVRLTGSFIAGMAAGVFHAFVPFRFTHLPHVQHVFAGWVPLLLVALLDSIDRPSWRTASLFGAVFLINGLTNIHWLLFGSFAIGVTALLFVIAGVRRWRELVMVTCLAAALLAPFLIPYLRVGVTRDWSETKWYSATWNDWLVVSHRIRNYAVFRDDRVYPEMRLFPGALSLIAAIAAIALAPRYIRGVTLGLLWTVIGVLGSLGLNFYFHQFLFDAVPGFRGIRVPARWAEIAYVGLAMLIAVATAFIARRKWWVAAVIPLLFVFELLPAPIRWFRVPLELSDVYRWLAAQPAVAVVELPIDIAGSEYLYAYRAVSHHRNLVNGASGVVPPEWYRFSAMFKSFPIPDEFGDELRRVGCDFVIVHADMLGPHAASTRQWLERELDRRQISFVQRFKDGIGGDWVFSLHGGGRRTTDVDDFVVGRPVRTPWTVGSFDPPSGFARGPRVFSGFASSPFGIRGAELLFEDGRVRVPAGVVPDNRGVRFICSLAGRPPHVPVDTDVQAVITDGRGEKRRLQFYWITWE